jgi:ferritin-like metal-binding protein YciE
MLGRLDTPMELFTAKLGAALKMEHAVLDMLRDSERRSRRPELRQLFSDHLDETIEHIADLGRVHGLLGIDPDERPAPAIDALRLERTATLKLTDEQFLDDVILAGAAEAEHLEIAVYEELLNYADAIGLTEVVRFLRRIFEQEQRALMTFRTVARDVARETLQPV